MSTEITLPMFMIYGLLGFHLVLLFAAIGISAYAHRLAKAPKHRSTAMIGFAFGLGGIALNIGAILTILF